MSNILVIEGGNDLNGKIQISGAKNSALPCLAACLLTSDQVILENIPSIGDVDIMSKLLVTLGSKAKFEEKENRIAINSNDIGYIIPPNYSEKIRGSTILMGALLARTGHFRIHKYGGCPIGLRPINFHLDAFKQLGAEITKKEDYIEMVAKNLRGSQINLAFPSVGATENIIIVACAAEGTTIINNAAIEPEIIDLIKLLRNMGAKIKYNFYQRQIKILGKRHLHGTNYRIISDRIEAGTYAVLAGIVGKKIILKNINHNLLRTTLNLLKCVGLKIRVENYDEIELIKNRTLKPLNIKTEVYPGFPTDLQPQFTTLFTQARGISEIKENIWEKRFHHIPELIKMGAKINIIDNKIVIQGPSTLKGTRVDAKDLRGGVSLVIAGLCAKGQTFINNADKIYRGYENLVIKLNKIGAKLKSC